MEITRRGLFLGLVGCLGARALPLETLVSALPGIPALDLDEWFRMRVARGVSEILEEEWILHGMGVPSIPPLGVLRVETPHRVENAWHQNTSLSAVD